MSFDVSADAYTRFMGRYSEPLAARFADLAGVRPGQRALDVGCGPGALTAELAGRLGAGEVCAVDPSESFAAAAAGAAAGGRRSAWRRPNGSRSRTGRSTPRSPSSSCTSWPTRWRACARWAG